MYKLPEFPAALSPENLMGALSDFTGMDWTFGKPDDVSDTSTYYQFSVDEIIIDRKGYSVGENSYTGPHAVFDSSYMAISVPFRLGASKDTVSSFDFISSEQAKTLCNADLLAQVDFPMRQRLGIAQAIMEDPALLLLDEPMNGLDKRGCEDMRALFSGLRDAGKTIVLTSHIAEDIQVLCDTVCEMENGVLSKIKGWDIEDM